MQQFELSEHQHSGHTVYFVVIHHVSFISTFAILLICAVKRLLNKNEFERVLKILREREEEDVTEIECEIKKKSLSFVIYFFIVQFAILLLRRKKMCWRV